MNPLILEELAQLHIDDLHRQASLRRLTGRRSRYHSERRNRPAIWLRRAFAS
jgi:hypothetical protein